MSCLQEPWRGGAGFAPSSSWKPTPLVPSAAGILQEAARTAPPAAPYPAAGWEAAAQRGEWLQSPAQMSPESSSPFFSLIKKKKPCGDSRNQENAGRGCKRAVRMDIHMPPVLYPYPFSLSVHQTVLSLCMCVEVCASHRMCLVAFAYIQWTHVVPSCCPLCPWVSQLSHLEDPQRRTSLTLAALAPVPSHDALHSPHQCALTAPRPSSAPPPATCSAS